MSYNLVINGSNVVNALKNTYRYDFINGTFEISEGYLFFNSFNFLG